MQLLCPYYVKDHKKQCCIDRCVVLSLKFELSESILKQLIKHLFHTFLLLFRFKSKYGCPISSKITKLSLIWNIIQLPRGLKIIKNSVPLLNFPFKYGSHEIGAHLTHSCHERIMLSLWTNYKQTRSTQTHIEIIPI